MKNRDDQKSLDFTVLEIRGEFSRSGQKEWKLTGHYWHQQLNTGQLSTDENECWGGNQNARVGGETGKTMDVKIFVESVSEGEV